MCLSVRKRNLIDFQSTETQRLIFSRERPSDTENLIDVNLIHKAL